MLTGVESRARMKVKLTPADAGRTPAQIERHYTIEKELAQRLRAAPKEQRRTLYTEVYNELFRRVPDHPQVRNKPSASAVRRRIGVQMGLLRRFLRPGQTFLEVGPGDCALSFEVAKTARAVIAVDVSDEISRCASAPPNFMLRISDGSSIPAVDASIDLVYSYQLMEHLHPDDALGQLTEIYRVLAPSGCYVCVTPNRFSGPHDISRYFDARATGFHLHEYTTGELATLFLHVGFRKVRAAIGGGSRYVVIAPQLVTLVEKILDTLPSAVTRPLARIAPLRALLGIRLIGTK